jgi:hypothetical protein
VGSSLGPPPDDQVARPAAGTPGRPHAGPWKRRATGTAAPSDLSPKVCAPHIEPWPAFSHVLIVTPSPLGAITMPQAESGLITKCLDFQAPPDRSDLALTHRSDCPDCNQKADCRFAEDQIAIRDLD